MHTGEQARLRCTACPRFWAASSPVQTQVSSAIQAQVSSTQVNSVIHTSQKCNTSIGAFLPSYFPLIFKWSLVYLQAFWEVYLLYAQGKAAGLGEFQDLVMKILFVLLLCKNLLVFDENSFCSLCARISWCLMKIVLVLFVQESPGV